MGTTTIIKKHATSGVRQQHAPFKRVMVVDEDHMDRLLSLALLRKHDLASEAVHFGSVFSSLLYLQSLKRDGEAFPDLVLLDLDMPIMDGFDFLEHFLSFPEHLREHTAVVVVSSSESEDDMWNLQFYPVVKRVYHKPLTGKVLAEIGAALRS